MSYQNRSKKLLIISTTITIVTLAIVLSVYSASILGTFQTGSAKHRQTLSGTITYSADNKIGGTWIATPPEGSTTSLWYARIQVSGYKGPVTITCRSNSRTLHQPRPR